MQVVTAKQDFTVIAFNEHDEVIHDYDNETVCFEVEQFKDEKLEVWKKREDGFLFVYCDRLEVGYWCHPDNFTQK